MRLANGHGWIMDRLPDGSLLVERASDTELQVQSVLEQQRSAMQRRAQYIAGQSVANARQSESLEAAVATERDEYLTSLGNCIDALVVDPVMGQRAGRQTSLKSTTPTTIPTTTRTTATTFEGTVEPHSRSQFRENRAPPPPTTSVWHRPSRQQLEGRGTTGALLAILRAMRQAREWGAPQSSDRQGLLIESVAWGATSRLDQRERAARAVSRIDMYEVILKSLDVVGASVPDDVVRHAIGLDAEDPEIVGATQWPRTVQQQQQQRAARARTAAAALSAGGQPLRTSLRDASFTNLERTLHAAVESGRLEEAVGGRPSATLQQAKEFVQAGALLPATLSAEFKIAQLGKEATTFVGGGGADAAAVPQGFAETERALRDELLGAAASVAVPVGFAAIDKGLQRLAVRDNGLAATPAPAQPSEPSEPSDEDRVRALLERRKRDEAAAILKIENLLHRGRTTHTAAVSSSDFKDREGAPALAEEQTPIPRRTEAALLEQREREEAAAIFKIESLLHRGRATLRSNGGLS